MRTPNNPHQFWVIAGLDYKIEEKCIAAEVTMKVRNKVEDARKHAKLKLMYSKLANRICL